MTERADEDDNIERSEYVRELINTLDYYIKSAKLEDFHREIIEMKSEGYTNEEIRSRVNKKYDKGYSANYISTIFRSKCCHEINEAAAEHIEKLNALLKGKEEFKKCNTCGKLLLKNTKSFVKKTRAKDGLAGRCKSCDKKARMQRGD